MSGSPTRPSRWQTFPPGKARAPGVVCERCAAGSREPGALGWVWKVRGGRRVARCGGCVPIHGERPRTWDEYLAGHRVTKEGRQA